MKPAGIRMTIAGKKIERREFLRAAAAFTAGGAAFYALGCGSGDDNQQSSTSTASSPSAPAGGGKITPVLLAGEFVANQNNRFVVGLLTEDGNFVRNAKVHAKFFTVAADGKTGTLRGEDDMEFVELNQMGAHEHDTSGPQDVEEDSVAFYVLGTPFDAAGTWAVELSATLENGTTADTIQAPFSVLDQPQTPALQSIPPASQNDTISTNSDTQSLCSRDPICPFHDKVIADVLGKGRPIVVQFSTPAFCETRFCGPVLEVLINESEAYRDRIDFVHIEVWKNRQENIYREAMAEWNLESEPWTFFMDGSGKLVLKIEAIFSEEELQSALSQLAEL